MTTPDNKREVQSALASDLRLHPQRLDLGQAEMLTDVLLNRFEDLEQRLNTYFSGSAAGPELRKSMQAYLSRLNSNPLIPLHFRLKVLHRFEERLDLFDSEMTAAVLNAHKIGVDMVQKEALKDPEYYRILVDMVAHAIHLAGSLMKDTLGSYHAPAVITVRQVFDLMRLGMIVVPELGDDSGEEVQRLHLAIVRYELLRGLDFFSKTIDEQQMMMEELQHHVDQLTPHYLPKDGLKSAEMKGYSLLVTNLSRPNDTAQVVTFAPQPPTSDYIIIPMDDFIDKLVMAIDRAEKVINNPVLQSNDLQIEAALQTTVLGGNAILDALRKAHVAEGEAGGITQHIGAYMVKLDGGERVVFVDTPGHEAFTGLRARGAKLTDVAVLVVAADDGVMPQTVEALNHARSAGVPIIVAVNKMDKEGADPEMVKRQLAEHNVVPEDWGGDTIFVNVSAHTGEGLEDLLEMLALQTEILELRANPDRIGRGVVIESRLDKGRGPVATVLVQNGTFHKGDTVVVGSVMVRIRAIVDENAVQHKTAGPSIPFELIGLKEVPEAGLEIVAVENERQAKDIVSYRKEKVRQQGVSSDKRATLDELFAVIESGVAEVPVLIKGDVTGSVEAMAESLVKAGTDEVKVKVIHKGIGGITESDIMLASASNAIVIGFNVRPETKAKKLAADEGVDVRFYKVIYDAIDEVKLAMAGKLSPDEVEKVTGSAEVREVFMAPKIGAIAGSYVTDGFVTRGSKVRVLRDGVMIHDGTLASLRRFRDDVKEVKTGYECGIGVENFNDVKEGDTFEFYIIEEVAATL
ncbi:MAG: translation initiation factor IF-2 [Ghiorsea sp.]|nr:translation initiation factor IF-2 [Ghiorsea sp.]